MIEEAMSTMPIVFLLIILLFGFDSTRRLKQHSPPGQSLTRSDRAKTFAQEISNFLKFRPAKA